MTTERTDLKAQYNRTWRAARLAERDARGVCRACGLGGRPAGKTICSGCSKRHSARARVWQKKQTSQGLCMGCSQASRPGKKYCWPCAEKNLKRRALRREQGTPESAVHTLVLCAKSRSKRVGLPFDLTVYDLAPLPSKCPVLGLWLVYNNRRVGPDSPSLDRLVPSRGYVRGNVRVISQRANALRSNGTADELEAVARYARSLDNGEGQ
jgi:hypothetical protein